MPEGAPSAQFEIGTYICPETRATAPLLASQPMTALDWPVTVEICARCGHSHVVQRDELRRPPVLGYE